MNAEKQKILDMIEKEAISAADGARLLECLGETEKEEKEVVQETARRMKGKKLKVLVTGFTNGGDSIDVDVGVPLVLARYADNIIENCVPDSVADQLNGNGVNLKGLNIGKIVDVFEELEEDIVNVAVKNEGSDIKVRVYVE